MGVGAAIAAGAVVGAGASIMGSKKASSAQKDAAEKSSDTQLQMYYQSRADLMPWLRAGNWALGYPVGKGATKAKNLYSLLDPNQPDPDIRNKLRETPGYQFRLDEGEKAISRGAAARGGVLGGRAQKELLRYGQDYASGEYDKEYTRTANRKQQKINNLLTLAGYGQSAGNMLTTAGGNVSQNVGQNYLYSGNARASGYINNANAVTGNVRSGMQDWMFYNAMKK